MSETANIRKNYNEFIEYVKELSDISRANEFLEWDMETYMPKGAAESKGFVQSTISGIAHEKFTSERMKKYLESFPTENDGSFTPEEWTNIRETRREYEKSVKIPIDLVKEISKTRSLATSDWHKAKNEGNFKLFSPWLEKWVDIEEREAEYLGYENEPYDALLDNFEPYTLTKDIEGVLRNLKNELKPMIKAVINSDMKIRTDFLYSPYKADKQMFMVKKIAEKMGFDFTRGRIDMSEHPFTTGYVFDTRFTVKIRENNLPFSIFAGMHEAGHALYQQGLNEKWDRTPMGEPVSMGIHESQSRLWENIVGRSREFWEYFYPSLRETFPKQLKNVDIDEFHSAINRSEPSLIRVEADELTYNMHIILRFEMERALLNHEIEAKEAEEVWNEKMQEYMGISPDNASKGILQDIHWAQGYFGYFPTYSLGNLYSSQLYNAASKDIDDLKGSIGIGDLGVLRTWLKDNIHSKGKMFSAGELCENVTGEKLKASYFVNYLQEKYGKIYGI